MRCGSVAIEAIEIFREHADEIVCVVLDLTMPRMSGKEAFQKLRRIHSDLKVILSTGFAHDTIEISFEDIPNAYLKKPYNTQRLAKTLNDVLKR